MLKGGHDFGCAMMTGVFFQRRWRDFATLTKELEPTQFMDMPPDPQEA